MDRISIQYRFTLPDESEETFDIELNPTTLTHMGVNKAPDAFWTRLDFHQCPHCRLTVATHPHCPLSANLVAIVDRLGRLISYDKVHVEVVTRERRVSQNTTAQAGISSLMGLVIAVSECPHTDFFKPMARFHLPFANEEETVWRASATYLMAQYFLIMENRQADVDLAGLTQIYNNIETLNVAIVKRLRAASKKDSTVNALIHLDVFAKYLTPGLETSLQRLRHIFAPYLIKSS